MLRTILSAALLALPVGATAQPVPAGSDTLRLGELQLLASGSDPRAAQAGMLTAQSALRDEGIVREWLPTVSVEGRAQYQSDVAGLPGALPGGTAVRGPPLDSYDAYLSLGQSILDPTRRGRRQVEARRLAESEAGLRASLYSLRQEVNAAFFAALLAQAQRDEVEAGLAQLTARLDVTEERIRLGAALPSEGKALEAELVRRRQASSDLESARVAALAVLADLTGQVIQPGARLALPELGPLVARARAGMDTLRARPEFERLERGREVLEAESAVVSAGRLPAVSAFARGGYGRPGLNPLAAEFTDYWLVGVQLKWAPWDWGARARQREILATQQRVLQTEEDALAERLRRGVANDLASMDRLEDAIAEDGTIIQLREEILAETRLRFDEGVVTSADYVDREGELLSARLSRIAHGVQLSQARARFLTTLGLEFR